MYLKLNLYFTFDEILIQKITHDNHLNNDVASTNNESIINLTPTKMQVKHNAQSTFICSKLTMETLEQGMKQVQS